MTDRESLQALARRWLAEASEHAAAAAEIKDDPRNPPARHRLVMHEQAMHEEAARVYRRCADELLALLKADA